MHFSTKAIHAADVITDSTGAVVTPIYQVSTYRQNEPGMGVSPYVYSRTGNPTRAALEKAMAELEEGCRGLAFASGMAAITTVALSILREGDHIVAVEDSYGGTRRLFDRVLRNFGVQVSYVKGTVVAEFQSAMKPNTKLVWAETPTNPLLRVVDISEVADIAHTHNALLAVDNTFMSPCLQQPLKLGADIVIHSTTKYLGGHSDLIGGAAVFSDQVLAEKVQFAQNTAGAVPGPMDCWLVLRGIKTLAVRMERHCYNAKAVSEFLASHSKVQASIYPGLISHPQHELAKRQMKACGGMVSMVLKGGSEDCRRLLRNVKVFTAAESLGGVESLIEHPSSMTHASLPKEERERVGVSDSLIRLSVGIEDVEDLITDLSKALESV